MLRWLLVRLLHTRKWVKVFTAPMPPGEGSQGWWLLDRVGGGVVESPSVTEMDLVVEVDSHHGRGCSGVVSLSRPACRRCL